MADELVFRRAHGTFVDRDTYLRGLADRSCDELTVDVVGVDEKPSSAVVTAFITASGTANEQPFAGIFRNARAFIRREEAWLCRGTGLGSLTSSDISRDNQVAVSTSQWHSSLARSGVVPEWLVTLLSTLVGGAIAFGTVLLQQRSARRAEADSRRERLTSRYLYQLQDAADSLWFRLDNLSERSGAPVMDARDPLYREVTTLYALGRLLAVHRMITLDGIWPELARFPTIASLLRKVTLEDAWPRGLLHYDRMALGEAILERDDQGLRTSTYLEFRRRYESDEALPREWRDRVWESVQGFSGVRRDTLLMTLSNLSQGLEKATGNESAVARAKRRAAATPDNSSTD
jgi:hypothetical protein